MSDMANFISQAPSFVGNLENSLAAKMAPTVTAKFGNRLPGFSGVTLPGLRNNIRPFPKARGGRVGDAPGGGSNRDNPNRLRPFIGRPNQIKKGLYF